MRGQDRVRAANSALSEGFAFLRWSLYFSAKAAWTSRIFVRWSAVKSQLVADRFHPFGHGLAEMLHGLGPVIPLGCESDEDDPVVAKSLTFWLWAGVRTAPIAWSSSRSNRAARSLRARYFSAKGRWVSLIFCAGRY